MKRSTERILTTHAGSLPRPSALMHALSFADSGELSDSDADAFRGQVREAVAGIVRDQVVARVDVVNDGEMSKIDYAKYVTQRLTGFGGESRLPMPTDLAEYPELARGVAESLTMPAYIGPVTFRGGEAVRADVANLRAATDGKAVEDTFMSAAQISFEWLTAVSRSLVLTRATYR